MIVKKMTIIFEKMKKFGVVQANLLARNRFRLLKIVPLNRVSK